MSDKDIHSCKRGCDIVRVVTPKVKRRQERGENVSMRQSGTSHVVIQVDKSFAVVPNTNKELGKGIWNSLMRALTAMGFVLILVAVIAFVSAVI